MGTNTLTHPAGAGPLRWGGPGGCPPLHRGRGRPEVPGRRDRPGGSRDPVPATDRHGGGQLQQPDPGEAGPTTSTSRTCGWSTAASSTKERVQGRRRVGGGGVPIPGVLQVPGPPPGGADPPDPGDQLEVVGVLAEKGGHGGSPARTTALHPCDPPPSTGCSGAGTVSTPSWRRWRAPPPWIWPSPKIDRILRRQHQLRPGAQAGPSASGTPPTSLQSLRGDQPDLQPYTPGGGSPV